MSKSKNLIQFPPRVFISWTDSSAAHRRWVTDLAKRLTRDGVTVLWDEWDLRPGQNKYKFMLSSIDDKSIEKVLIVCDAIYKVKADRLRNGVGIETRLFMPKVLEDSYQERFIPIIREYDENARPCKPDYLSDVWHLDFSLDERFEEQYRMLVRNIYGKLRSRRPKLGNSPPYI